MHGIPSIDAGRAIDWGKTSADYATHRGGYPADFYGRLTALGVGLPGQRVLDLGTGTGVLARQFAAQGCAVTAVDVSSEQIEAARSLAAQQGLAVRAFAAPAEETGLPDTAFDIISAAQAWLYFDHARMIPEVKRLLAPGGRLVTCHLCWLPRVDPIARASEELVLRFNPAWSGADYSGDNPPQPPWSKQAFTVAAMFYYDVPVPFTRESWRGRLRACRGIGATLPPEQVEAFDREHDKMLAAITGERFTIVHRIDAHVFAPR